jgi:hypothetical protein
LGAIPVGNDDAVPATHQTNDGGCGPAGVIELLGNGSLLTGADERVAADGD